MNWPMEKLGVVAPAKPIKKTKLTDSNSVWLLNLDMIESHTGRVIDKLFCSADEAGTSTHWFDENYVLYSKLRPYLNKVVVPDGLGLATTELVPMLPDPERLDRKYLAYYLRSEQFVRWVNEQVAGAKMPRVSMKIFWEHEIPLPPLEEQKRIVAILDKADAICQKRQQATSLADDFLRSVFLDMFGDPVTNPKEWNIYPLKNGITNITAGWSANGENHSCGADEIGVLKISAVTSGIFKPNENKVVSSSNIPSNKKLVFPRKGDLLFSRANTRELVGATCIVDSDYDNVFLPDKLWVINLNSNELLPEYVHMLIQHPKFKECLTSQATGSSGSMLNISKAKFEGTLAPYPSLDVQQRFKDIFWKVMTCNALTNDSKINFDNQFNALSQKAFSGQL